MIILVVRCLKCGSTEVVHNDKEDTYTCKECGFKSHIKDFKLQNFEEDYNDLFEYSLGLQKQIEELKANNDRIKATLNDSRLLDRYKKGFRQV